MADTYLSVVDNDDNVVGRQLRSIIHKQGLRHREVHVWLVTPKMELIFQRRGPYKDTNPDMLGASVGGHVEEGQNYMQAALAEMREEAGLDIGRAALTPLCKVDLREVDAGHGTNNYVFRMVYLYRFAGEIADLVVEEDDGAGFVAVPLADVLARRGEWTAEVVPALLESGYAPVWRAMKDELRIA